MEPIVERLLSSDEPSVRFKARVNVLGENPDSRAIGKLRREIKTSDRVQALLSGRGADGRIPRHPYSKYDGAHWVLSTLADIGYPPGDESLVPLREQVMNWLLARKMPLVPVNGRVRRCASQESNAVYAMLRLGLADERVDELVDRLITWQWPDGGWNCDRKPEAKNSSFHESWIPLRALALYAKLTGKRKPRAAAKRASEIFLKRRLYKRQSDGSVIRPRFCKLFYPAYWHYGILAGLTALAEAGLISDKRCTDALDLLESKRLGSGGWPAEGKYYNTPRRDGRRTSMTSRANWGGVSKKKTNPWVTADALFVLKSSGRLR